MPYFIHTEEQTSMTMAMASEMFYHQEGEDDTPLMQSTPRKDRQRPSTSTTFYHQEGEDDTTLMQSTPRKDRQRPSTSTTFYHQEGEDDTPLMLSTPRKDRQRPSTSTTITELVLVPVEESAMPVSTSTPQKRDVVPNRPQLKQKKRKVDDPYDILVSDEREKVKLEVKKCRLEINKLQMDAKLTQLMYVKETLLVRKIESEMVVLPMVIGTLLDLADSE